MVSAPKLHHSVVFCIHRTLLIAGVYCNDFLEVNNILSNVQGYFWFLLFNLPFANLSYICLCSNQMTSFRHLSSTPAHLAVDNKVLTSEKTK